MNVAAGRPLVCPVCGAAFDGPSAESFSFNSEGACKRCGGTGIVRTVDESTLVPDESLTIDQGAVAPWNSLMWSLMTDVCRAMGVRTDVPFSQLTQKERDIVFHGPAEKKHIFYRPKNGGLGRGAGLHLFQRRLYGGKRPGQGEGRQRHEAGGTVFEAVPPAPTAAAPA